MSKREYFEDDDSWDTFENALDEAVQNYVEDFADHLAEDYNNYNVTIQGVDSSDELIDLLGLDNYEVEVSAAGEDIRSYDIHLPDSEEPVLVDVERSVADNSIASDEDRETVAYNLIPRSEEDMKLRNIYSEFCRLTFPDGIEEDVPLFYRSGDESPLAKVSSWEFFDEEDLMQKAVEKYEETYGAEADFSVELGFESGKDWRIYEFDFDDIDEVLHLELSLRGNGFSMNWKQDEHQLRYRNFVREGFAEAIEELTD